MSTKYKDIIVFSIVLLIDYVTNIPRDTLKQFNVEKYDITFDIIQPENLATTAFLRIVYKLQYRGNVTRLLHNCNVIKQILVLT